MKTFNKLKAVILLLAVVAVSATSCKKDKTEKPKAGAATVAVGNYGFDGGSSGKFSSTAAAIVKIGPIFNVTAIIDGGKQSININLLGVTGVKEYDLDAGNASGNVAYMFKDFQKTTEGYSTQNSSAASVIGGGKVNITKLTDTEAEGTFYVIAYNSAKQEAFAENGTFKGTITKE
ncbi:MAG: hypothetical protein EOP47_16705 [Sphingobacteriaceae bacterium]|nr:MAG: hypothetical protein EOP47_16705 [Sphingobacteriaceae bacterium]